MDKARLYFARILIPTLEVVNTSSELLIDGCKYRLKLLEDWGCCLGENTFFTEEGPAIQTDVLSEHNEVTGMKEVREELDDLMEDLNNEWCPTVQKNDVIFYKEASNVEHASVDVVKGQKEVLLINNASTHVNMVQEQHSATSDVGLLLHIGQ